MFPGARSRMALRPPRALSIGPPLSLSPPRYLRREFPELDYAKRCVVRGEAEDDAEEEEAAEEL